MPGKVVIVDDDRSMCEMIESDLRSRGFDSSWYVSADEAFTVLRDKDCDVVLTDLQMPGTDGIALCKMIVTHRPDVPVVVITAFGSLETAVAALRAGAYDFITKPFEMDMLVFTLERAINHRYLQHEIKRLAETVKQARWYEELLGESTPMQELYDLIGRVADSEACVLIRGESGTGKELVARALHKRSRRSTHSFVAVNCAALPETLLESELFGHTRGAFTDAKMERKGLFQQADGGTLWLDEIGAFPMALQPKLLRALEERSVRPVGSDKELPFDVRVITGTNRDLESAVEEGRFRDDLLFRINVIPVEMPPLRSRGCDILLLAQHFLEKFAVRSDKRVVGISEAVGKKLLGYPWPGNVRELRNAIEHAVVLTRHEKVIVEDLPDKIRTYRSSHVLVGSNNPTELLPMEEVERRYIQHVLKAVGGNKTQAARVLGLDRKTLYRKLGHYGAADNDVVSSPKGI